MKKRLAALFLCVFVLLAAAPAALAAGPDVPSESYVVMNAETGQVLYSKNPDEELDPASITKVMTLGLACRKAAGSWDTPLTVSHEDVYSLYRTDSSHIALQEGETAPLADILYATMMASANDGANVLASYIGGDIAGGVAAMNEQAAALGLAHTHFANPHGISVDDHYTSAYDMACILRWALEQPGFETLFSNNEMYTMQPTNLQPEARYFSQQDPMRIGSSRHYTAAILGSKIGYTNLARYTYVCLAEQDGVRLICVVMKSESKPEKYADVAALLSSAFSAFTETETLPGKSCEITVKGGGAALGTITAAAPEIPVLLADGLSAQAVSVTLDAPQEYLLGTALSASAVVTVEGGGVQADTSFVMPLSVTGLDALLAQNTGASLLAAEAEKRGGAAGYLVCAGLAAAAGIFFWQMKKRALPKRAKRLHSKYK